MSEGLTRNLNVPTHGCLMCTKCTRRHCPICYKCPEPVEIHKLGQIPVNAPVCDKCGLVFLECQCPAKGYGFLDRTITKEAQHALSRPNHTVEALDALRSAVVAQTALLRELSQQVRLFEGNTAKAFELTATNFAALAERLDKQAEGRSVASSLMIGSLNAIEGRLAAIEAKLPAELEELRQWKKEAIAVMPDYQEIGKILGLKWGESVHDKIIPALRVAARRRDKAKR